MSEQHQGHDPILAALLDGYHVYIRDYLHAPGRQRGRTLSYDRGVVEGVRWAIETYEEMSNR